MACSEENIYQPHLMRIGEIREETFDTRMFRLEFTEDDFREHFRETFRAGMFGLYGVFGEGECPLCVASPQTRTDYIECTFRKSGRVTTAMFDCDKGDVIGYRGPYGRPFPIDKFEGHDLLFVAGGIGLAPARSVILSCLDQREKFGDITIIYGARSVDDLLYREELKEWARQEGVTVHLTVDPGGEDENWKDRVGFVPTVLEEISPSSKNCYTIMCGPPIMIKFSLKSLESLGFEDENVYTTLENRMKCGVGKCGRCNIGSLYVCKDGPVFTAAELGKMPGDDF